MPIYLYKCSNCGANIEKMQSVTADPLVVCPECHHKTLKKVLTAAGIIFKGSGWYVTDSRKASSATTTAGNSDKSESGEKPAAEKPAAEKPAAEAKSESKSSEPA